MSTHSLNEDTHSINKTSALCFAILGTLIVLVVTLTLWQQFKAQGQAISRTHLRQELLVLSQDIFNQVDSAVIAMERMAQRWGSHRGTPKEQWLSDVRNYIEDFDALTTIEWVDKTYHVKWVEPLEGNEKAVGLNIVFDDERKKALEGAAEQNKLTLTPPLDMVQGYRAFISYAPIYIDEEFEGFMAGIYDTEIFINSMLSEQDKTLFHLRITDKDKTVFQNTDEPVFDTHSSVQNTIKLFNREWLITISPKPAFLAMEKTLLPEITLLLGSLFALLIGFAIYTAQISSQRSKMLREKSFKLAQANAELEEYAYRISHDLRSPIISSVGLMEMCKNAIANGNNDVATKSIDHACTSLSKLVTLIEDILALTQIKSQDEEDVEVDLEALIDDALDKFTHMDNYERLDIQKDLQYTAPLKLKKSRITLIVENLLSNCIKYQDLEEEHSYVKITSYKDGKNLIFKVEDNGLGIPADQHENIFAMFRRFHTRVSFGSGLGLYMMKKSADILEGEIKFEDPGKGTIFILAAPIN
jgi:sensor domain CHASE-containing protein/two-component sensor histidine kinase